MKPHRSRSRRIGVFLIVAFVLYSVLGFVVAPVVLKSQLEKRLPAELGRSVRMESIRVNPWILSLSIKGMTVADRDEKPFVAWDRIYVNFDPTSFFVREWRFQEITVLAPSAHVTVNKDGTLNFSDLLTKFGSKQDDGNKPAWPLRVAKLVVTRAQLDFADHSRSQEFATQVGPVNFALLEFYTSPNRDAPYEFSAETESGEKLRWSGKVSVNPISSEGELQVSGIRPAKYAPYYRDLVRFDVLEGSVDVSGRYKVGLSEAGNVATLSGGRLQLLGIKVAQRSSTVPVIEINDLEFAGVEADANAMQVSMTKVSLVGGRATVRRDEQGEIDLLTMIKPGTGPADESAAAPGQPSSPKPRVEIGEFTIRQFGATFEDRSTPRPAINVIENAEVDVQKLTLADGASMPFRAALTLPRGGAANLTGSFTRVPLQATATVELANVSLASVSPYVEPLMNIRITQGAVSARGEARIAVPTDAPVELEYKGDFSLPQFGAVDGLANEKLFGWSQLAVTGIDLKAMPLVVAIKEVALVDPSAHVLVNQDRSINLLTALQPANAPSKVTVDTPNTQPAAPAESATLPRISVGVVNITNGAFTFADRSVQPEVSTAINQLAATISGLSSDNLASADVALKASVAGSGPVSVTGKLNPLGTNKSVDLKVEVNDVELTPFSPYSGKFAGFELARGKLFVDVNAKMENETLDMKNVVTLTQFTFGAPTQSPEATKLPVRLAVALLKDSDGKITLDVPVQGSFSDPSFRIGKVVAGVIMNLLTKVATSPFSLLGAMFGGGGEELAFQDFGPGEAELSPDDVKKLETLTKALNARPALNLEISGSFDPAADALVLKQRRFAQLVRSRLWDERRAVDATVPPPDQLVVTPEDEQAMVQKLFVEKFPESVPETTAASASTPPPAVPAADSRPAPAPNQTMEPETAPKPIAVVPDRRGFLDRAADVVTFKALRDNWSERKEREEKEEALRKAAAIAPPLVPAPTSPAPVWAGPPFEEMKSKLTETMNVTTDDLRRLAARRAERVREYFIQQNVAGERLFLANVGEEGRGARAFLQLQ